jgi:hypothetical protein
LLNNFDASAGLAVFLTGFDFDGGKWLPPNRAELGNHPGLGIEPVRLFSGDKGEHLIELAFPRAMPENQNVAGVNSCFADQ